MARPLSPLPPSASPCRRHDLRFADPDASLPDDVKKVLIGPSLHFRLVGPVGALAFELRQRFAVPLAFRSFRATNLVELVHVDRRGRGQAEGDEGTEGESEDR